VFYWSATNPSMRWSPLPYREFLASVILRVCSRASLNCEGIALKAWQQKALPALSTT